MPLSSDCFSPWTLFASSRSTNERETLQQDVISPGSLSYCFLCFCLWPAPWTCNAVLITLARVTLSRSLCSQSFNDPSFCSQQKQTCTVAYKNPLCWTLGPITSLPHLFLPPHTSSSCTAFLVVPQHARYVLATGPLHWLFPLPRRLSLVLTELTSCLPLSLCSNFTFSLGLS